MARTTAATSLPSTDAAPTTVRHSRVRARGRTRIAAPETTLEATTTATPAAHRCAVCGTQERVRVQSYLRGATALCDQARCRRRHEASRLVWLNEAITLLAPVNDDELPAQLAAGRSIARCGISSSR